MLSEDGSIEGNELFQKLMQGLYHGFLVSDVSTYEYLQSVGLHIIANDTLRRQITKLYDVVYEGIYGVEKNTLFLQEDLLANIRTYYTAATIFFKPKDNLQAIRSDDQLRFNLKSVEFSHQIIFNRYQDDVVQELEKLLQMIGQELAEP